MPKELHKQVRSVRIRLKTAIKEVTLYQDLEDKELPQWAEWEYYRLVDLVGTAEMVAHRLEVMLEAHVGQDKDPDNHSS